MGRKPRDRELRRRAIPNCIQKVTEMMVERSPLTLGRKFISAEEMPKSARELNKVAKAKMAEKMPKLIGERLLATTMVNRVPPRATARLPPIMTAVSREVSEKSKVFILPITV